MTLTWYRHFQKTDGFIQILKRQTTRFHYGSKVPAVTITVFITILEQNRQTSCQSSTKPSEGNVKNNFNVPNWMDLISATIFFFVNYTVNKYEYKLDFG